jgi:hypothetical protein
LQPTKAGWFSAFDGIHTTGIFRLLDFICQIPLLRLKPAVVPLLQIRKDDKSKQRMTESVTHGSAIFW